MRRVFYLSGVLLSAAALAAGQTQSVSGGLTSLPVDPAVTSALAGISPEKVQADIEKLVTFGTRNTLSSMDTALPPGQGINAAADWITSEFRAISAQCGGCMEVKRDEFVQPASTEANGRVPQPTKLVNVYAILHGTGGEKAPWVLVTGHYDRVQRT